MAYSCTLPSDEYTPSLFPGVLLGLCEPVACSWMLLFTYSSPSHPVFKSLSPVYFPGPFSDFHSTCLFFLPISELLFPWFVDLFLMILFKALSVAFILSVKCPPRHIFFTFYSLQAYSWMTFHRSSSHLFHATYKVSIHTTPNRNHD